MNNKILIVVLLVIVIFGIYMLFSKSKANSDVSVNETNPTQEESGAVIKTISSSDLEANLENKNFKIVDVHIPEQKHIPQTDYIIPYNDIDKIVATLPDKDEKIVLYCRSGGMSRVVAEELVQRGYTNVFDLDGGINKWISEGREVVSEGTINNI